MDKLIMAISKFCYCDKRETISLSNYFNSDIQRKVRSNFNYETRGYWVVIK